MNRHFIMVTPVIFNRLHQRHHAFAQDLCRRGNRVTFIEPLKAGGLSLSRRDESGVEIVEVTVPWRCSNYFNLHTFAVELAWRLFSKILRISPEQAVLWVSEPSMASFSRHNWQFVLYDRCDLHGQFPRQRQNTWKKYENILFRRSEIICLSHAGLLEDIQPQDSHKAIIVPNACSELFLKQRRSQRALPPPLRLISSGAHYEWIDCEWLKQFAGRKEFELHIAGTGRGRGFEELIKFPGVVFHGELAHEQLAAVMGSCHVGLLPFRDMKLVRCVDPIKAWEYAAAGLQIWATDIEPMRNLSLKTRTFSQLEHEDLVFEAVCTSEKIAVWSDRVDVIIDKINQVNRS